MGKQDVLSKGQNAVFLNNILKLLLSTFKSYLQQTFWCKGNATAYLQFWTTFQCVCEQNGVN